MHHNIIQNSEIRNTGIGITIRDNIIWLPVITSMIYAALNTPEANYDDFGANGDIS
jgi:hypothetical protein